VKGIKVIDEGRSVGAQELANDPLNIFKAPSKLQHRLVLSSAYAAGHEAAADADPRHRRRYDHKHHEPKVTVCCRVTSWPYPVLFSVHNILSILSYPIHISCPKHVARQLFLTSQAPFVCI
jgi:hypothetical protein